MVYQIKSDFILIGIDRASIIDISPGDRLDINGLCSIHYEWKHQDSQFMESNPDAEIYLGLKRAKGDKYEPVGLVVRENSTL